MRRFYLAIAILASILAVNPTNAAGSQFFIETGYAVEGRFLDYWEAHGGLAQFGFPISPLLTEAGEDGQPRQVQYFERNRFELHPEKGAPYDVLLSRLGLRVLEARGINWQSLPKAAPMSGCQHFGETGHNLCEPFASYWRDHGGLAIFGLPLTEAFPEVSSTDGQTYMIQYFERNRFEYHPENPPAYRVQLGLLGSEASSGRFSTSAVTIGPTLQRIVDLTNAIRRDAGIGEVSVSARLTVVAGSYSRVQASQGGINHVGPDGSRIGDRLSQNGYSWSLCAENLAAGSSNPDATFEMWMRSPAHRAVILDPNLREIGLGWTFRPGDPGRMGDYWVMVLATPR